MGLTVEQRKALTATVNAFMEDEGSFDQLHDITILMNNTELRFRYFSVQQKLTAWVVNGATQTEIDLASPSALDQLHAFLEIPVNDAVTICWDNERFYRIPVEGVTAIIQGSLSIQQKIGAILQLAVAITGDSANADYFLDTEEGSYREFAQTWREDFALDVPTGLENEV